MDYRSLRRCFCQNLLEYLRFVNRELGEHLAIDLHALLREPVDEHGVLGSRTADRGIETDDPETAEIALLLFAVHVGVLSRLDHALLRLHERRATDALIALCELADLLMPAMPDYAAFDAHDRKKKSEIREERLHEPLVRRVDKKRPVEPLLALILLLKEMASTVALDCIFTGTGYPDPFLCAAVRLELTHTWAGSIRKETGGCKGKSTHVLPRGSHRTADSLSAQWAGQPR